MNAKTQAALLRAVGKLIDTGRFELGMEEPETAADQEVVNFMRGLRIGSGVRYAGKLNTWRLDSSLAHKPLVEALQRALPLLEKLGDFIGNGKLSGPNSLGERCDVILAAKEALELAGAEPLCPDCGAPGGDGGACPYSERPL
jgi:hypothetical protein